MKLNIKLVFPVNYYLNEGGFSKHLDSCKNPELQNYRVLIK